MKKKTLFPVISLLLICLFIIKTAWDYVRYQSTFSSVSFHLTVLVNACMFLGPVLILFLILKIKDK